MRLSAESVSRWTASRYKGIAAVWINALERLPEVGRAVTCRLQHCDSKSVQEHELKRVDESDCTWRTADDGSEVRYDWSVIEWLDA